jgi:ABC-type nitrate/sulfonate/bicarbonate transport system substrate-binding protein
MIGYLRRNFVVAACILGAGLAPGGVTRAQAEPLRVGTPEGSAFMFAVIDVGTGAGIFKKHGLSVEKLNFAGGGKLGEAMAAGALDFTVSGNTDVAFVVKGSPQKAVAVTAGPPIEMSLIVRSDGSIKTPQDLKGKTIGVTSPTSLTSWLALEFSRRQGWGPDGVKRAFVGGMTSQVAGLVVKHLDAIVGPVEGGYLLEAKGQAHVLTTFGDLTAFITHLIYASNAMIKDHPDQVRGFVAAWFDTVKYMRGHKEETIKLTEPATHLPPDIASKVYDLEMPAMSDDGRFDPKAVEAIVQSFLDLGVLEKRPADLKELYTDAFLPGR